MIRKLIKINEELCDGCGKCVPTCAEGALQVIDGKVRLISDLFCDGLGACLGECPTGALSIEKREAEPYDEFKVMENIVRGGKNVIKAHLKHMLDHQELGYYEQALQYLKMHNIEKPSLDEVVEAKQECGCPGSAMRSIEKNYAPINDFSGRIESRLSQWPVQLHLLAPNAPYLRGADLLLTADCVPVAYGDFHRDFLKINKIAIACPKLDTNKQVYIDKLTRMIAETGIKSLTVIIMEVPCCSGLLSMAQTAIDLAGKEIPLFVKVISIEGEIIHEQQL